MELITGKQTSAANAKSLTLLIPWTLHVGNNTHWLIQLLLKARKQGYLLTKTSIGKSFASKKSIYINKKEKRMLCHGYHLYDIETAGTPLRNASRAPATVPE